jgi:hypothetical protein
MARHQVARFADLVGSFDVSPARSLEPAWMNS